MSFLQHSREGVWNFHSQPATRGLYTRVQNQLDTFSQNALLSLLLSSCLNFHCTALEILSSWMDCKFTLLDPPPSPQLTKPSLHKHTALNLISTPWDLHLWCNSVNVKDIMARTHLGSCVQLLCSRLEEFTFLHHTQICPGLSIFW